MRRLFFSGLRSRLFILVLIAILPALGLILFTTTEQRRLAEADAREDALQLARLVATDQELLVDEARRMLIILWQIPAVRDLEPDQCSALLADLLAPYPQYMNVGVVTTEGRVACSASPLAGSLDLRQHPEIQDAFKTGEVTAGRFYLDPATGRPVINFSYALQGLETPSPAAMFAVIDLNWLNRQMTTVELPEEAELLLIDSTGTVLIHRPDPERWIGQSLSETPLIRHILDEREGALEAVGLDGVPRLYAFTPLHFIGDTELSSAVGVSAGAAFAKANRFLNRNLAALSLVFLLALAAAWFGGDFFILRRIRSLLHATRRLEGGDLSARTGLPYGRGELSQLALAFDQMTEKLQRRELERKQVEIEAERHNRDLFTLNTVTTAINTSLELPEIVENLKRQLADQLDIPGGVIFFYDEMDGCLYLEAAWGIPPARLAGVKRFPAYAFHYGQVLQQQQPVLIPDYRMVEPYASAKLDDSRPSWLSYLCVPLLAKGEVQGVIDLFREGPTTFNQDQVALFTTLGQQVGVVLQNARLFAQVRDGSQRLQMLSQQLLEVQEGERRHIARELHDQVGQALTAVKVNLQTVIRLSGKSTNSRYLEESILLVERVLHQVRDLSLELRPSLLDDLGVVSAVRWYVDRQGQRAGFITEFVANPPDIRLPPDMETVCFRVVQEALTNVVRHAVASHVQVKMTQLSSRFELVIRDNGIGFNVNSVRERSSGDLSLGLLGMQERVQLIGGQFEILSDPDHGTEIRATFDLPERGRL